MNGSTRTFLLVALVVAILLALHLLPTLQIGDTELRKVNILSDILPEEIRQRDAIDMIPIPEPPKPTPPVAVVTDSTRQTADSLVKEPVAYTPQIPDSITAIDDYGLGQPGGMAHFYRQLSRVNQLGRPVRIAYFGDSFVEGDILSCDLREQLQTKYGGSGVGWVDCASQVSGFRQTVRHTFKGLTEYEVVKRPFKKQYEGIAQRYFTASENAIFTLRGTNSRKHLDHWQTATFYFRTEGGFNVATRINNDTTLYDTAYPDTQLQTQRHRWEEPMNSVSFQLSGLTENTYLYGVALEPDHGIVVDNFSMRGSSGISLGDIPMNTLSEFAAVRPYDLLIFHFGLNVASEKSHAANYKSYTKSMGNAIEHLREAYPEASVLVVSMPDRDQRTDAGIRTMLGVESLVAYQQLMAADHHVAFFNLFQAMGGCESMKALVDKGLANKDYTHLTFAGGKRLATRLVESLNVGYDNYKRHAE